MADEPSEDQLIRENTIIRNILLVTTPYNILIFVILPALNVAFVTFVLQYHWSKGMSKTVFRGFMMFAVVILPCALVFVCMMRADRIKAQLERQGYVQRWTRARLIDFAINLVVFAAFAYSLRNRNSKDEEGDDKDMTTLGLYVYISLSVFMLWLGLIMASIGPVVYFTVKVRRPEQR